MVVGYINDMRGCFKSVQKLSFVEDFGFLDLGFGIRVKSVLELEVALVVVVIWENISTDDFFEITSFVEVFDDSLGDSATAAENEKGHV